MPKNFTAIAIAIVGFISAVAIYKFTQTAMNFFFEQKSTLPLLTRLFIGGSYRNLLWLWPAAIALFAIVKELVPSTTWRHRLNITCAFILIVSVAVYFLGVGFPYLQLYE